MSAPVLELLPAVDISEGYAVRPVGGTLSGGEQRLDPVEAALTWVKSGARWIHLVDLDLAFGRGTNTEVLAEVVAAVRAENARGSAPVRIQVSGGVRNAESLERALSLNPDRVNVTSAALADSSWLEGTLARYADSDLLALGLDARYNPERGWVTVARGTDWSGPDLAEALAHVGGTALGKRQAQNTIWQRVGLAQNLGGAHAQQLGLARARPGDHQERAVNIIDRLALIGVQLGVASLKIHITILLHNAGVGEKLLIK